MREWSCSHDTSACGLVRNKLWDTHKVQLRLPAASRQASDCICVCNLAQPPARLTCIAYRQWDQHAAVSSGLRNHNTDHWGNPARRLDFGHPCFPRHIKLTGNVNAKKDGPSHCAKEAAVSCKRCCTGVRMYLAHMYKLHVEAEWPGTQLLSFCKGAKGPAFRGSLGARRRRYKGLYCRLLQSACVSPSHSTAWWVRREHCESHAARRDGTHTAHGAQRGALTALFLARMGAR